MATRSYSMEISSGSSFEPDHNIRVEISDGEVLRSITAETHWSRVVEGQSIPEVVTQVEMSVEEFLDLAGIFNAVSGRLRG